MIYQGKWPTINSYHSWEISYHLARLGKLTRMSLLCSNQTNRTAVWIRIHSHRMHRNLRINQLTNLILQWVKTLQTQELLPSFHSAKKQMLGHLRSNRMRSASQEQMVRKEPSHSEVHFRMHRKVMMLVRRSRLSALLIQIYSQQVSNQLQHSPRSNPLSLDQQEAKDSVRSVSSLQPLRTIK